MRASPWATQVFYPVLSGLFSREACRSTVHGVVLCRFDGDTVQYCVRVCVIVCTTVWVLFLSFVFFSFENVVGCE